MKTMKKLYLILLAIAMMVHSAPQAKIPPPLAMPRLVCVSSTATVTVDVSCSKICARRMEENIVDVISFINGAAPPFVSPKSG